MPPHQKWIASLFLLPDCNMTCRFCGSESGYATASFAQVETLLRELAGGPIRSIVFGGGEPTLWPHGLADACALASGLGFHVQVCTNGLLFPPGFAALPGVNRFILPLEAEEAAGHDRLRDHAMSHLRIVLDRVERIASAGREMTFSTVITKENQHRMVGISRLLQELWATGKRIHAWHLYRFLPVGRSGARHAAELAVADAEFDQACKTAKSQLLHFPVYRRDNMLASKSVEFFWFDTTTAAARRR